MEKTSLTKRTLMRVKNSLESLYPSPSSVKYPKKEDPDISYGQNGELNIDLSNLTRYRKWR